MSNPPDTSTVHSPAAPSPVPLDKDLPCLHCGYNLRTRLPSDNCPECNTPVQQSITFHHIHFARPPESLTLVALLFAIPLQLLALLFIASGALALLAHPFDFNSPLRIAGIFQVLIIALGMLPAYALLWRLAPISWRRPVPAIVYILSLAVGALAGLFYAIRILFLLLQISGSFPGNPFSPAAVIANVAAMMFTIADSMILVLFVIHFLWDVSARPWYRSMRRWILPLFLPYLVTQCALLMLYGLNIFAVSPMGVTASFVRWVSLISGISVWIRIASLQAIILLWLNLFRLARKSRGTTA